MLYGQRSHRRTSEQLPALLEMKETGGHVELIVGMVAHQDGLRSKKEDKRRSECGSAQHPGGRRIAGRVSKNEAVVSITVFPREVYIASLLAFNLLQDLLLQDLISDLRTLQCSHKNCVSTKETVLLTETVKSTSYVSITTNDLVMGV
jgi:hypothetical protein